MPTLNGPPVFRGAIQKVRADLAANVFITYPAHGQTAQRRNERPRAWAAPVMARQIESV